jgi:hypothetical protein
MEGENKVTLVKLLWHLGDQWLTGGSLFTWSKACPHPTMYDTLQIVFLVTRGYLDPQSWLGYGYRLPMSIPHLVHTGLVRKVCHCLPATMVLV